MKKFNGRKTARNSGNAYAVSVVIALLLASVLLATYYVALRPQSEGYMTIYLLDSQKKGVDYPNSLVANVNSTFSVYVYVENHMGRMINGTQVLVKVTSDSNPTFPLTVNATQTLTGAVKDGETGETAATVTLNQPGNYLVAFE
jgi:uncharacterized membrane protein